MKESLFRRAKLEAARQGKPLSAVIEEALERHLSGHLGGPRETGSRVEATWGAMAASPELVRAVMEEEDGWLDT